MISSKRVVLLLMLAFCGTAFGGTPAVHPQASHQSPSSAEAREVFIKNCAGCHGREGKSNTPLGKAMNAADLTSAKVQGQSNAALARFISAGGGQMPAFKNVLSPQQIADQAKYVRTLGRTTRRK